MPKYRVTKAISTASPVGSFLLSDDLHPFLIQHVVMVDERPVADIMAAPEEALPEKKETIKRPARNAPVKVEKDLTPEQIDEMHAEAIALDKALYPAD